MLLTEQHSCITSSCQRRLASISSGCRVKDRMKRGYVYIMTNQPNGTLYTGVTAYIAARVQQHRTGTGSDFCKRYGLIHLVYAEAHDDIETAIWREKAIKAWKRAWKLRLISAANPRWDDLFDTLHLD